MSNNSKINFPKNEAIILYEKLHENYSIFYKENADKLLALDISPSSSTSSFWKEIVDDVKKHINPNFKYSRSTVHKIFFANQTVKFERNFKYQAIEDLKDLNFYYQTQTYETKAQNEEKAGRSKQNVSQIKDVLTQKKTNKKKSLVIFISLIIVPLAIFLVNKYKTIDSEVSSLTLPPYKIMIVPFDQEISYQGSMRNIGSVIEKRLLELNKIDSLGIQVLYKRDFRPNRKFSDITWEDYYRRIMKENDVDHIIYGSTREEKVSSDKSDKISLNYIISEEFDFLKSNTKYVFKDATIKEVTQGKLQENLDMLVYLSAALSNINSNRGKSLKLIDKIINYKNFSKTAYLEAIKIRLFSFLLKINISNNNQPSKSIVNDIKYILENDKNNLSNEIVFNLKLLIYDKSIIKEVDSLIKYKMNIPFLYSTKFLTTMIFNDSISDYDINNVMIKTSDKKEKEFVLLTAANFYTYNSDYKKVLKYCNLGLSEFESIQLKYFRGLANKNLRKFDEAINDFNYIIEKDSNEVNSYVEKGLIHLIKNDFVLAENSFINALNNCNSNISLKNEVLNHISFLYADYNLSRAGLKFYTNLNIRKEKNKEAKISILLARMYFNYQLGDFENGKLDSISVLKIDNNYFIKQDSIYNREKEIIDSIRKVERKNMFKDGFEFIKKNYN